MVAQTRIAASQYFVFSSMPHKGAPAYCARKRVPGLALPTGAYLVKPQNTSRIMLSSFSVRVSPTR